MDRGPQGTPQQCPSKERRPAAGWLAPTGALGGGGVGLAIIIIALGVPLTKTHMEIAIARFGRGPLAVTVGDVAKVDPPKLDRICRIENDVKVGATRTFYDVVRCTINLRHVLFDVSIITVSGPGIRRFIFLLDFNDGLK